MLVRVIDFETTGYPPNAAVIEAAWCDLDTDTGIIVAPQTTLCNPFRANPELVMTPEAQAVHHIDIEDLGGAPSPDIAFRQMSDGDHEAWAAHNNTFEREFFAGGVKPWICTLKIARRVWPDAPSHSNQVLRYWLGLKLDRSLAALAHRAGPDTYVTAHLLRAALETGVSVEQVVKWSNEPSLLPTITFGKHKGSSWEKVPLDYLDWLNRQTDLDPDTKFTVKHHIQLRCARAH